MTLLEKYAYERIAREGEQARTQSVHTLSDCTEGRARRRCGVPIKLDLLRVRGGREYRVDRTAANPREPRNIRRPQFLSSRPRKPSAAIFSGEMPIDAHAPDTLHNIRKGDSDTSTRDRSTQVGRFDSLPEMIVLARLNFTRVPFALREESATRSRVFIF